MNSAIKYSINNCAVLIIAAGESRRLGSPKQLLIFEGDSLINRIIKTIHTAVSFPIHLVLGASADTIQAQLPAIDLNVVMNQDWKEGMASSIRIGLTAAMNQQPNLEGVVIVVCDQPYLNTNTITSLFQMQKNQDAPITAAYYNNIVGTPALFHKRIFPALLSLNGDQGAKRIIQEREEEVAKLHFEQGAVDIDTKEDYQALLQEKSTND